MNEDTKYDHTRRRVAGLFISRALKRYGIGAKLAGAGAVVAVAAVVAGAYYGIDIDLGDDTVPPPPIIEPVNETSTPPLIEGPEDPNKIKIGQSQPPAPSSNTSRRNPLLVARMVQHGGTRMDPNTQTEGEYVAALTERERDIYSRGHNTGLLARGRISFGPIPLFDPRTHTDAATDGYTDADCDHDNIRCTHVDARTERRRQELSAAVANRP